MASMLDMPPSWLQDSHLALSTTFQPQGLGSLQGPTVACWCSAYSTSRSSSATGLDPVHCTLGINLLSQDGIVQQASLHACMHACGGLQGSGWFLPGTAFTMKLTAAWNRSG
jgi:hypothetical protein